MLNFSIYKDQFTSAEMQENWSERSTISSWLEAEQALATCQAELNIIPSDVANKLQSLKFEDLNLENLTSEMALAGRPIVGLVKQIRKMVDADQETFVHYGSTTQDIMDTGLVLQMHRGLELINQQLITLLEKIKRFNVSYGNISMIGRTNGQHAIEITLGAKLNVWLFELKRRHACINEASARGLNVQCGGPVGDLRSVPEGKRLHLKQSLAYTLKLNSVEPHWQNARDGLDEIITALGLLCSSLCKIARNINLLSSSDIGEMFESPQPGKGGSSSMAHKKNQRCSEFMEAIARLGRQQAEAIHETNMHEHERSGGVWISEWLIVPEVFQYTSGALMWANQMFDNLSVDNNKALSNLNKYNEELTIKKMKIKQ
ncbi:lyase family protein [Marinomonas pollencensis]|uniref:3-carboxy-cis,cis-muconate cycloisomerase n=1 Tax=Marinomonas pollencensis TaxID=491954 RepID=A0A3E0DHD4_9GAMM|nr:lyase family protein [Marinomonas pollencensis]REG82137.1 3-carboxy-cis,cis-muconate cycloisomerase [Marinomonas pollencensis]